MSATTTELTPAPLTRILLGFCRSRLLMSAAEVNLFGLLATGGRTEPQLRAELNLHPRYARDFLDALTSLGVLTKEGDQYTNTELAARFLDPGRPSYLGGFLELAAGMQWTAWGRLTRALRTGEIQISSTADTGRELFRASVDDDPERVRRFMAAMDSHSTRIGDELARRVDWSSYQTFADIGGARGNLAAHIVLGQPHLRGICFDRPASELFFTEHIAVKGLTGKVVFQAGDFFTDPLPAADVLIYGHVLHDWDPETRKALIRRAYQALRPGGALIIYDRMIDDQLSDPDVLLFSLTFMLTSAGGSEYRVGECLQWLRDAGFTEITATPILENHTFVLARR
jgi:SAM-dependent methyltransferase